MTDTPSGIVAGQIAELLAWARRLTEAGTNADPAEKAAYHRAKADLLTRLTNASAEGDEA
ncbi:hypothetical protein [Phytohabitans kaempferiae]|uniref:DUF1843 domain-containing protein n=1 Tax=Phytohabitans kaempferiae TaxID=1620943 RepID=A0ABV6M7D1_9ACTN